MFPAKVARALKPVFISLRSSLRSFNAIFSSKTKTKSRRNKEKLSDSDLDLPQELLIEILVRLPIKDLVKSTAVCKSWNSLIKNPSFISTHLQKSISNSANTNSDLLFFSHFISLPYYGSCRHRYSLRFDNKALDEYKELPCPYVGRSHIIDARCYRVAGSYNGLVCLVDDMGPYTFNYGHNFVLWNPLIKKAIHLPEPSVRYSHGPSPYNDTFTGFGFDSKTNDYKLLRFVELDANSIAAEVYSLNANCWRIITPKYCLPNPKLFFGGIRSYATRNYGSCFVNGAIHLLARDSTRNLVLAFDVSDEVFAEIPLPDCLSHGTISAQLLKYGQFSVATMTWEYDIRGTRIDLWVMEQYEVATSRTKVLTSEAAESVARVLFFRQDEQVFVSRKDGRIALFDIKSKNSEYIFGVDQSVDGHSLERFLVVDSYVESLVLLDKCCDSWMEYDIGGMKMMRILPKGHGLVI